MTHIPAIGQDRAQNSSATYNAVKIQINNPRTNIPEDFCPKCEDNNDYNSVNIEVNDPAVEGKKKSVYDYPEAKELVTYDQAFVKPKKLPPLPAPLAYQIINNRTLVNAEFEIEQAEKEAAEKAETEEVTVPEANYTTVEDEKTAPESALSFHGNTEEVEQTEEAPAKDVAFRGEEESTEETSANQPAFKGEAEQTEEAPANQTAFKGEAEQTEEAPANQTTFKGEAEQTEEAPANQPAFKGEAEQTEEAPANQTAFKGEAEQTEETPANQTAFKGEAEQTEEAPANQTSFKGEEVENSESANNVNFKAAKEIEIVPPEEIKPDVDINVVVENLNSEDYDVQAKQIYDIVSEAKQSPEKAQNYVVTDVFSSLTDIIQKDVSNLERPDETKNDLRKKYIINEIVKEQARLSGEDPEKAELPYVLTDEEKATAVKLTDFEMAERNKDYALTALAVLAKEYADGVEKQSGNTVPLTDLPGVSACVDTLRYGTNPDVKVKAVEALMYINRPEYKDELKSIFELSAQDKDPDVAMISTAAVQYLNEQ